MSRIRNISGVTVLVLAAGCAYTPAVTTGYYFPRAETQLSILETIACLRQKPVSVLGPDGNPVLGADGKPVLKPVPDVTSLVSTVTPATTYRSDLSQKKGYIRYSDLDGPLSDADLAISFTDDGRLQSINASSTGEGDTIVKNAVTLATTLGPLAVGAAGRANEAPKKTLCDIVVDNGTQDPTKGETITVSYNIILDYKESTESFGLSIIKNRESAIKCDSARRPSALSICADDAYRDLYTKLIESDRPNAGSYSVRLINATPADQGALWEGNTGDNSSAVSVDLNKYANATLEVDGPSRDGYSKVSIWKADIQVPIQEHYSLPIPKAAIFGKQQFGLTLTAYGSISKLEYGKNTGAGDVLDAAAAVAAGAGKFQKGSLDELKATQLQGQSDLIYQQQRLALCLVKAPSCSGK